MPLMKSLQFSTPCLIRHSQFLWIEYVICVFGWSAHSLSISLILRIFEISSVWKGVCMIILPASFHRSNVIDITRNRQVIQVYSSLLPSSHLKMPMANQNNNLLITMIIDDPEVDYSTPWRILAFSWYYDSTDWYSCSAIWKEISCDWTTNWTPSWRSRMCAMYQSFDFSELDESSYFY